MLRKFIKSIIPNKGDVFFNLFIEEAIVCCDTASTLVNILSANDAALLETLYNKTKSLRLSAIRLDKRVLQHLNKVFITPIDRGDIQELSGLFAKLAKRIAKISSKLNIYNIDANNDDCLIKNANTLLQMTQCLHRFIVGLKECDQNILSACAENINELEENGTEDFRHAINEMFSGKFDTLTILKLKEVYKNIDTTIETSITIADLITQVSLKNI